MSQQFAQKTNKQNKQTTTKKKQQQKNKQKRQTLFSMKNETNITNLSSAQLTENVIKGKKIHMKFVRSASLGSLAHNDSCMS